VTNKFGAYVARFHSFKASPRCRHLPNNPKNDDAAVATFRRNLPVMSPHRPAMRPQTGELTQSSKIE
jgi:hypothetical protein